MADQVPQFSILIILTDPTIHRLEPIDLSRRVGQTPWSLPHHVATSRDRLDFPATIHSIGERSVDLEDAA